MYLPLAFVITEATEKKMMMMQRRRALLSLLLDVDNPPD